MVFLDYLETFQVDLALYVISAIGFLCVKLKQFNVKSIRAIQKVVFLVPIPALLFREIGVSKLTAEMWKSFAHAAVISVVMHIISAFYALFTKKDKGFIPRFVEVAAAFCQSEFTFYSYMIASKVMSSDLMPHATLAMFFQYVVVHPLHMLLAIFFVPNCVQSLNTPLDQEKDEVALDPKEHHPNNAEEDEHGDEDLREHELEDNPDAPTEQHAVGLSGNPEVNVQEKAKPDDHEEDFEKDDAGQPIIHPSDDSHSTLSGTPPPDVPEAEPKPESKPKPWTATGYAIYAVVNQFTICGILGIIWSAIGIDMPSFLSSFVEDLESAIFGAGLFTAGAFIAIHPFKGAPIVDVVAGCIMHYVIQPLLALAFGYALSLDKTVATFLIFANCSPTASWAFMNAYKVGLPNSTITYTFYWTTILTLPALIIWLAIVNETQVFT